MAAELVNGFLPPNVDVMVAAWVSVDDGRTLELFDFEPQRPFCVLQVSAAGPEALMIFAADKVSKVRELRAAIATARRRRMPVPTSLLPRRRLAHFRQCLEVLEQTLGDAPLVRALGGELVGLGRDLAPFTEVKALA